MRPVTAALLLVGLMFLLDSASANPYLDELCKDPEECEGMDDEGWVKYGENSCVKAFHEQRLTFSEAEEACVNVSGHLVAIHSPADQDKVVCSMYRATPYRPPYWIGLQLTFHYEGNLIYDWTDGTTMNYNSFGYGQPDFLNEAEFCVETNYYYWGAWNDVSCQYTRPYVCQVKLQ